MYQGKFHGGNDSLLWTYWGPDRLDLSLSRTQSDEQRQVRALASGLRVNSASDDPSGLAIAENLQTQVGGMQQAAQGVQTASNMLDVADGALDNVQMILQRVRSLIVEARNDFASPGDLQQIQTQIDQMMQEIDKIAGNAKFNGVTLFDGSHDDSPAGINSIKQVTPAIPPPAGPNSGSSNVTNADGMGNPGPLVTLVGNGIPPTGYFIPAYMAFQITGYSDSAVDPDSGMNVGPGVYITFTAYSTDPNLGAKPIFTDTSAVPVNSGQFPSTYVAPGGPYTLLDFQVANLTAADVGTTIAFESTLGKDQAAGTALQVNDHGNEGTVVNVSLPTITAQALSLAGLSVQPSDEINVWNQDIGNSVTNAVPAGAAEQRVDDAMDQISQARAQIGAQTVALNASASDLSAQIVNEVASESEIRDDDVGQSSSELAKDQVLTQITTGVLSQMQIMASLVLELFAPPAQTSNPPQTSQPV